MGDGVCTQGAPKKGGVLKVSANANPSSLDPQTGKITMFDDRGNKLTTELGHPAMKGTVYHLTGTNSDGKPQTVDWINDGTGRLQSADELRRFVAYEKGLAVLKAGSSDDSQIKSQLTRTSELERRYGNKPDAPWRKLQKLRIGGEIELAFRALAV